MDKKLLKVTEAAEWASVGRSTAYMWVRSGEWPSIRRHGVLRVPLEGLEEWARANLVSDTDEQGDLRVTRR
jgi:excisionase family DNA binding protein